VIGVGGVAPLHARELPVGRCLLSCSQKGGGMSYRSFHVSSPWRADYARPLDCPRLDLALSWKERGTGRTKGRERDGGGHQ
jgi:hypothetical protein